MQRIILTVINDLETDQRVNRAALTLVEQGFDVKVIGRKTKQSKNFSRPYFVRRFRVLFAKSWLFYAEYNFRLFFYLLFQPCDMIFSNDVDTLLPCWLVARIRRKRLVFDSHELYSELPELVERPMVRNVWRKLEDWLIPKVDEGITVCQPIADIYQQRYHKYFHVIRNVPFSLQAINSETKPFDTVRIIYQGAINKGRGLFLLVDSMAYFPEAQLLICGAGYEFGHLKNYVDSKFFKERIHFLGRVEYDLLPAITRTAHVGVSLEEDLGLNYRFASPNKLFDYIQAQIPVVVSDLPVMANLVKEYKIGEVLSQRDPEILAKTLKSVVEAYRNGYYTESLQKAAKTFSWDVEKKKFLAIFGG